MQKPNKLVLLLARFQCQGAAKTHSEFQVQIPAYCDFEVLLCFLLNKREESNTTFKSVRPTMQVHHEEEILVNYVHVNLN